MPRKTRKDLVGKHQENNEERQREREIRDIKRKLREDREKANAWDDLKRKRQAENDETTEDDSDE